MTKRKVIHLELAGMEPEDINQAALDMLDRMLICCSLNLVSELTGITRTTLYKWLDENVPLEGMRYRDAAWFILFCEQDMRVQTMLARGAPKHPRLQRRTFMEQAQ